VFLVNSRLTRFTATSLGLGERVPLTYSRRSFSRSYGSILPSSLASVISSALGFSPHLPVSVYGTVTTIGSLEVFLGSVESMTLWAFGPGHHLLRLALRICLQGHATGLDPHFQPGAHLSFCVTPVAQTPMRWFRNIKPDFHRLRLSASA
jgi:hypothetical protein